MDDLGASPNLYLNGSVVLCCLPSNVRASSQSRTTQVAVATPSIAGYYSLGIPPPHCGVSHRVDIDRNTLFCTLRLKIGTHRHAACSGEAPPLGPAETPQGDPTRRPREACPVSARPREAPLTRDARLVLRGPPRGPARPLEAPRGPGPHPLARAPRSTAAPPFRACARRAARIADAGRRIHAQGSSLAHFGPRGPPFVLQPARPQRARRRSRPNRDVPVEGPVGRASPRAGDGEGR